MKQNEKDRTYNYDLSTGRIICVAKGLSDKTCPFCNEGTMLYNSEIVFDLPVPGSRGTEREVILPGYVCEACDENTLEEESINTLLTEVERSKGNKKIKARVEGTRVIKYLLN